jgi:hypothetical protein
MLSFSPDPSTAERQMHAIITYLVAFGHVDGDFDSAEKGYVRDYVRALVRARAEQAMPDADRALLLELVDKWTTHFHEVVDDIDTEIRSNLDEPTADGESGSSFAMSRLKLKCFELFKGFDEESRQVLLDSADELIRADGSIDPREEALRAEMAALLEAPVELDEADIETLDQGAVVIGSAARRSPRVDDHPFFSNTEWHYATDKATFAQQAERDLDVLRRTMQKLDELRGRGRGKLALGSTFADFASDAPFMDGHVVVHPPRGKDYELLVLGDLHGCYSCLKAALLQVDFFEKVQRYHDDPENQPNMLLVFLGDYIDRGLFSYNGVLRTVLQLFLAVPDHVVPLRGNHEYYVELNGRVYGAVKPSEAMASLKDRADDQLFAEYMRLFEALPNSFVFDQLFMVHAGIPRDDTFAEKWKGIESLNDYDLRFQMMWSDPSEAEVVPLELQKQSARFAFGKRQFRHFMREIGCTTMIRGHEKVIDGFREVYADPDARLLNLFSAGGQTNDDLPADSSYREVKPMALTVKHHAGVNEIVPFEIDYERFNDPSVNAFFREAVKTGGD